jgi:hypothetical protein
MSPRDNDKYLDKYLLWFMQVIFPANEFMEWKDTKQPPL